MLRALIVYACCVLAAFACQSTALGADPPATDSPVSPETRIESAWEVSVSPFYGWVPGVKGRTAVFGQPSVDIDVTPIDIIRNVDEFLNILEGLYKGNGHIRRGDLGFMWDVVYFDVAAVNHIGNKLIGGDLDVGFALTMATLTGTYRAYEAADTHIDILGGARVTNVDLTVGVDLGLVGEISGTEDEIWVDPIIGVRGRKHFTERAYVDGWAMIGGFGVSSDLLWDVYGVVGYDVRDWISLYAGYRGSKTDYRNGAYVWDVLLHGPIVGFEVRF